MPTSTKSSSTSPSWGTRHLWGWQRKHHRHNAFTIPQKVWKMSMNFPRNWKRDPLQHATTFFFRPHFGIRPRVRVGTQQHPSWAKSPRNGTPVPVDSGGFHGPHVCETRPLCETETQQKIRGCGQFGRSFNGQSSDSCNEYDIIWQSIDLIGPKNGIWICQVNVGRVPEKKKTRWARGPKSNTFFLQSVWLKSTAEYGWQLSGMYWKDTYICRYESNPFNLTFLNISEHNEACLRLTLKHASYTASAHPRLPPFSPGSSPSATPSTSISWIFQTTTKHVWD